MRLYRHPGSGVTRDGSVAALGSFDGFLLGHQAIVARAVEHARRRGLTAAAVLLPTAQSVAGRLATLRQRSRLLSVAGVEVCVPVRFSARTGGADRFLRELLVGSLRVRAVVVGEGIRFGRDGQGDAALIESCGRALGFDVDVVSPVAVGGQVVCGPSLRRHLSAGDLAAVERMLGRPYSVCGRVVHGHHRGKGLGIPTANLLLRGIELPPDGVYAVRAEWMERRFAAVANVGRKPTFGDAERTVEVHILDFDREIYGSRLSVAFVARLRGEVRFPNVAALVEQIRSDIRDARRLLSGA
jgi:riboflavin kinase/FMN adenylyltransferase